MYLLGDQIAIFVIKSNCQKLGKLLKAKVKSI